MNENYYEVFDSSGSMSLYKGELFRSFPAAPENKAENKWSIIATGNFPSDYKLSDTSKTKRYQNDTLLVNAFDSDKYLFIESRFIKRAACPTCNRPYTD